MIGVARHVQMRDDFRDGGLPQLWLSYAAKPWSDLNIVIRGGDPGALAAPVERAVADLKPGRPVHEVRMLAGYLSDAMAPTRFALLVLGAFAVLSVVLSAVGVYGVVAYASARRTREIAVRLALGADRRRIFQLVTGDSAAWFAGGLVTGLIGASVLTRFLNGLLFGVAPTDRVTFAAVSALLTAVAIAAATLPAARATRTDPMLSLRAE